MESGGKKYACDGANCILCSTRIALRSCNHINGKYSHMHRKMFNEQKKAMDLIVVEQCGMREVRFTTFC